MLTVENVWDIVRKFDGVSIPFNPSIETGGIFEIILPTNESNCPTSSMWGRTHPPDSVCVLRLCAVLQFRKW